jgi:membrane dipeptidase
LKVARRSWTVGFIGSLRETGDIVRPIVCGGTASNADEAFLNRACTRTGVTRRQARGCSTLPGTRLQGTFTAASGAQHGDHRMRLHRLAKAEPTRRAFLQGVASLLAFGVRPGLAQGLVPIADMHSHLGMFSKQSLADQMRANGVALVAWSLPADLPWIHDVPTGVAQKSEPAPGEPAAFFAKRLDGENASIVRNGLKRVLTRSDVEACVVGGEHGVVLASEGADFLEGRLDGLGAAVAKGLRHLQLVHYIRSFVGDRQTSQPQYGGGLTDFGRQLVEACNEQGLLIDLAHCAEPAVDEALRISKRPMIWSHSWVGETGGRWQDTYGYEQRRLSIARARAIADRGGVVGLWGLGLERPNYRAGGWPVGRDDPKGYAKVIAALVDRIGAEHVGIGSDLAGLGKSASVDDYAGVRRVVEHLQAMKLPASSIERIACGNYARTLKEAFRA